MNACIDDTVKFDISWSLPTTSVGWIPPMGLAKLNRWPDLSDVPDDLVMPVARISALLWNKPTATHLINRLLDGHREETFRTLRVLQLHGYIEFISAEGPATPKEQVAEIKALSEEIEQATPTKSGISSFLGKLRNKLLG